MFVGEADDDVTNVQVGGWLDELAAANYVEIYTVRGQRYGHIRTWAKHQRVDNAGKHLCPALEEADGAVPAAVRGEIPRDSASCGVLPLDQRPTTTTNDHDQRPAERVFSAWQESTGRTKTVLDPQRRRLVATRLREGLTEEDLLDAVRGWAKDPWPGRVNQNKFSQLLRSRESVETFRDFWRNGAPVPVPKNDFELAQAQISERVAAARGRRDVEIVGRVAS